MPVHMNAISNMLKFFSYFVEHDLLFLSSM